MKADAGASVPAPPAPLTPPAPTGPRAPVRAGLAVLSGLLVSLAFPSWISPGFRPWTGGVAWFALVPLLAAIEGASARRAALVGWLAGFSSFLSVLYWILEIEQVRPWTIPAWMSVSLALGAYWGLWAAVVSRGGVRALALVAPAAWAAIEILRGRLFTGFPWAILGASQWAFPQVFLSARFVGVAGVSMAVVAVNVAVWALLRRRREAVVPLAAALVFAGGAAVLADRAGRQVDADLECSREGVRMVLLQGAFTEEEKFTLPVAFMMRRYERMSLVAAGSKAAGPPASPAAGRTVVMVWPETATATDLASDPAVADRITALARKTRGVHLVGALWHDPQLRLYNGAFVITRDGPVGAYYKSHLVPFGEYIPGWFRVLFPFARKATEGVVDFTPGPGPVPVDLPDGTRVGMAVCYEAVFPEHARALALSGAQVLVNITNDSWYGRSAASFQHALGPLARAVENGRFLARCANTGVSFIADPRGRPGEVLGLFEMGTLHGEMAPVSTRTFYTEHGDAPVIGALLAALALVAAGSKAAGPPAKLVAALSGLPAGRARAVPPPV